MSHAVSVGSTATISESVDDIPLLLAHLQRLGLQRLIDAHFPVAVTPGSLSLGWVTALWLTHMLSQSGRQVRNLRSWVIAHPEMLQWLVGQPVRVSDIGDGRLRDVLRLLDDDSRWRTFEAALNQHILRMYRLRPDRVRLTHSSGLWYITSEGVLQFDHSRRWWPGAMQVHITLAELDAIGLPASVYVAPPEHELPPPVEAIVQTRAVLPGRQKLFVGNGELGAAEVRAMIHAGDDIYLCLLNNDEALAELQRMLSEQQALARNSADAQGGSGQNNDAYERIQAVRTSLDGNPIEWSERRLLIRSHRQVSEQETELQARLARAQRDLSALNERKRGKRRPRTITAMREAADAILIEHGVQGLLQLNFDEAVDARTVRRYRGRPTTTRVEHLLSVVSTVDEAALTATREQLGWQVYATTLSPEILPLDQTMRMIGESEASFERLRGRPLSLLPGVIQRTDHIRGLVRLLTLGLRGLALLDIAARARAGEMPAGTWQWANPQIQPNPTGERLLDVFHDLTLTIVDDGPERRYHLTALSSLQRRVLDLLALPQDTYQLNGGSR